MSRKLLGLLRWSAFAITGVAIVVVISAVVAFQFASRGAISPNQAVVAVFVPFAIMAMVGAMAISVVWMRSIDEAAREAHKSAWFWGGCGGMSVGGVFFILASIPQTATIKIPTWFQGRADPVAYAATGAGAIVLLMVVGYTLAWAWWWWKRR